MSAQVAMEISLSSCNLARDIRKGDARKGSTGELYVALIFSSLTHVMLPYKLFDSCGVGKEPSQSEDTFA